MSNPYANLANVSALPPTFFQHNAGMANLNMADLQAMGQQFGMDMGMQGQGNQSMYSQQPAHQTQFNVSALANIPASALGNIQIPGQSQHLINQGSQQQMQSQQNKPNNFNPVLDTFHRIQAQERMQVPDAQKTNGNAGQSQSIPQGPGGQQFLQQMNHMARMQQQQSQQQNGGGGGQQQQMRGMNGVNLQAVMAGLSAQGMGQSGGGQGQGPNQHSQQQGLQVGSGGGRGTEDDTESGRRIALQNMLVQNMIPTPQQQQQTPYQQQMQLNQALQQQQQSQIPPTLNSPHLQPEVLKLLMNLPPHQREPLLAKHNNNPTAAVQELMYQHKQRQAAQQAQGQGQGGSGSNVQSTQQRMPQAVSVNGINQQQQQQQGQQGQGRGGFGHQRSESQQMQGGQGPSPMQGLGGGNTGQNGPGANFDQKQFEALQQMKERQQRQTGLITPQMASSASLPLVSPQPPAQQLSQQQQQQQQHPFRQTPQNANAQLPQQQNQQFNGQQSQQQSQPQQGNGGRANADETAKKSMADIIREWSDDQLRFQTATLLKKMINASPNEHPSRFYLLTFMADFKRRGIPVPSEAITVMGTILGGAPAVHQMLQANWHQLQMYAQKSASQAGSAGASNNQGSAAPSQFRQPQLPGPSQQQQAGGSFPPQRQSSMTGSQGNPIEIVTPKLNSTPSMSNASLLPFTPSTQHGQLQPSHQRQSSYSGQTAGQTQQQTQGLASQNQLAQNPSSPNARWGGVDFRDEPLPFSEPQMWDSLKKMHKRADLPIPTLEGRQLDVYALMGLVHRNGGSHRLDQNPTMWSIVGGCMGFGQGGGEQPARAGPATTTELRRTYAMYLGQFEDAWYGKLFSTREQRNSQQSQQARPQLAQAGNSFGNNQSSQFGRSPQQQQMGQSGSMGTSNSSHALPIQQAQFLQQQQQFHNLLQQAQQTNQPLPANLSAQLLEAAARNPGMLNDQQRLFIEHARRMPGGGALPGQGAPGGTPNMPNMALLTPSLSSLSSLPQTHGAAAAMLAAQNQAQNATQQHQPVNNQAAMQHAAQTLRGNPGLCLQWIKSKEEQMKAKFTMRYVEVAEPLRPQILADLRTLAAAAKDAQEKMPKYLLVSAEKGPTEFALISGLIQLYMVIIITHQQAEQGRFCFGSDQVQRLKTQIASLITSANTLYEEYRAGPEGLARLDRLFGGMSKPSPRDTGAASGSSLAANMPKGLRVEDLKPPPSKRAKGKAPANGSPAPGATAPTPESVTAKTPASHIAESPVATSSPAGPAKKTGAKRKRGGTVNAAAKDDNKDSGAAKKENSGATPSAQMPPPPAPPVDIIPTAAEIEAAQHRAFFKARSELEENNTQMDIFAAFASVVEEFNAALASTPAVTAAVAVSDEPAVDADFFAQWIDIEQMNGLPTPELYHPGSLDDDPDTSPESIRTVASTTQVTVPLPSVEKGGNEGGERRLIEMSPGSGAYNGGLFWEEYDFGMGITG